MARYRCYFLRGDGHIATVEEFTAPDDKEATETARTMHRRRAEFPTAELWSGCCVVASLSREAFLSKYTATQPAADRPRNALELLA